MWLLCKVSALADCVFRMDLREFVSPILPVCFLPVLPRPRLGIGNSCVSEVELWLRNFGGRVRMLLWGVFSYIILSWVCTDY